MCPYRHQIKNTAQMFFTLTALAEPVGPLEGPAMSASDFCTSAVVLTADFSQLLRLGC